MSPWTALGLAERSGLPVDMAWLRVLGNGGGGAAAGMAGWVEGLRDVGSTAREVEKRNIIAGLFA